MKTKLTTETIRDLTRTPPAKTLDVYDTQQAGLVMRIRPSGAYSYRTLLGRGRWHTLGGSELKLAEARELARGVQGEVSKARALGQDDPVQARKADQAALTLTGYFEEHFEPWATENRRSGASMAGSIRAVLLPAFGHLKLAAITPFAVERWRTARLKAGVSPSTINRNLDDLKAMLSRAVTWKLIPAHPIASVRRLRIDRAATVRYLTPAEEARLLAALKARDDARRAEREASNAWRRARGYAEWPEFGTYTDALTPVVTLALHTGLRRGELFSLCWRDVNLDAAMLTVQGATAKSAQTRHVPLNDTATTVLTAWKPSGAAPGDLVFPSPATGDRFVTLKTSWSGLLKAATITAFRFHDCRHTFASKLVMGGVDLNTVRELLGHSDLKMTLRYAHLAPEHKAAAVAVLVVSSGT
ncbi:MAG: tyrosine-type recombinase/integrase [Vicinamibacterales bacterium]